MADYLTPFGKIDFGVETESYRLDTKVDELMPMPIYLAYALTRKLALVRKNGTIPYLGPDGKAQVSVEYEDDKPVRVDNVVIFTQCLLEIDYAARYVAKNLVAAGIAHRCEIQIAYAIGVARPVSVSVNTFETGTVSDEKILELIDTYFDLRPSSIINGLGLRKPIYRQTAAYGHFGRKDLQVPWEWTDKVTVLRNALAKTEDGKEK